MNCPNNTGRMLMIELKSMHHYDSLPRNKYGIKEMTDLIDDDGRPLEMADDSLDLVIVPGVAFSLDGRRLGHGKGYYDEFLWNLQQRADHSTAFRSNNKRLFTIGLALREQLVDEPLAVEGQDYSLDEVLVAGET